MSPTQRSLIFKIFLPFLIFFLPFFVPSYQVTFDVATLLTVISLLFAILVGFFIATATTNHVNLQGSIAEECGQLISMHNLGSLVRPTDRKKIAQAIDDYTISSMDFSLITYVDNTSQEVAKLIAVIDALNPPDSQPKRLSALNYLHETKSNWLRTRQLIATIAPRTIKSIHWFILVALTAILIFLLISIRGEQIMSDIVIGFLIVSSYLILVLLYEVDSDLFLEQQLNFIDNQRIFRAIGQPDYYPEIAIKQGRMRKLPARYRVGLPRKNGKFRTIKFVNNKTPP